MELNFNNLQKDSSGRLRFSGISSGMDTQALVDSMIEAKRISARNIEDRIDVNETRMTALSELKTLSTKFKNSLDLLRSPKGFSDTDVFNTKQAFASSRAKSGAPAGHKASSSGEVVGITVDDTAVTGSHTIEVLQVARAHQVRSGSFTSPTKPLSEQGFSSGDIEINGQKISIGDKDSLLDVRDRINNTSKMNVTASVISVSDTEHYLVLTSKETGEDAQISFGESTQAVHNALGLTKAGTNTVKNELQSAQNALIRVDGLGVDIERQTNVIDDVIGGVTFELFSAEPNTEIVLDVEQDLKTIKSTIVSFVEAYNELKDFLDGQQTERVRKEGEDPSFGPLYNTTIIRQIEQKLTGLITGAVPGLENGAASLGQVGIKVNEGYRLEIDEKTLDNTLISDTKALRALFGFSFESSDPRVNVLSVGGNATYRVDDSGNPLPYYLNIAGTDDSGKIISANLKDASGKGDGGVDNGSAKVSGNTIEFTDEVGAEGLRLFFNGEKDLGPIEDIKITYTRGIADSLFDFFDDLTETSGIIDDATTEYAEQNQDYKDDVAQIDRRLALQRKTLSDKFLAMEESLHRLETLKDQIKQQTDAMNGSS